MAFFRKKDQEKNGTGNSDRRLKALDADSQAKWDELERLVSSQAERVDTTTESASDDPSDTDLETLETPAEPVSTAPSVETPESDALTPENLEFGGHDLRRADTAAFASDLKVDLPDDSLFLDVTPESIVTDHVPTASITPTSLGAEVAAMEEASAIPDRITAMMPSQSFAQAPRPEADHAPVARSTEAFTPPPPARTRPDRADIGAMRLDVARISSDIQSGEELYRRAQQRIENLTSFVERAEVDFSMLNRLEPENRRLKARNRTLEREIDATGQKIDVLRADLKDREQRLIEKSRVYEATVGKLSVVQKSLQEYERALNTTRESADRNSLNAERLQTSLDVERRENEVLRQRITDAVGEMDMKQTSYIEAKKIADSLAQDCADYRHQAETAQTDADDLRKALATAQTSNNAMKAEMMGLHEDIRTFKTQSEFTIISREDELTALQQQVDHLSKQLDIKDDIVRNAVRDVQELRKIRTAQDLERERLEAQIQTQAFQLDQAGSDLLKTKQDVSDFDRRYRDVATALSVSQARRMSNEPAATPDIQPHKTDGFDDLSTTEIEDRIMDFRLGLREDIT